MPRTSTKLLRPVLVIAAGFLLHALPGDAEVRLPAIFGDHMVLQRDQALPVWGWAAPGESVRVEFLGQQVDTRANAQGQWRVDLPPAAAGGPHVLRIVGANTIELQDVLIGEVWLCSGQSNMEMGLVHSLDAEAEIAAADHPRLRLFHIPRTFSARPQDDVETAWKASTPETIAEGGWGGFSAAAYSFGRHLQEKLDVPIGLIQSAWGGTRIEPWTPPAGFAAVPELASIHRQVQLHNPHSALYQEHLGHFLDQTAAWLDTARTALQQATPVPAMPTYPTDLLPPANQQQPSVLYNAMIHPIVPFALRGAIWYQGESNHLEGALYTDKMRALIEGWRSLWPGDFPFYYVQIAPYHYGDEAPTILPKFWQAQNDALAIPHTGMAVIHDVGDIDDIHPKNKREVGRRLALWAMAQTYGASDLVYSGPLYRAMEIDGAQLRLRFDHAQGLSTRDGLAPDLFELIDADQGGFVAALATIEGEEIVLQAPGVDAPVAVRFAWHKLAAPNLINGAGLPAAPFRAGAVPERDLLELQVPEASQYTLVYDLDLAELGEQIPYALDRSADLTTPFDRIAYFLELTGGDGEPRYLYVSMDAFTDDLALIGIPTTASEAHFQQPVEALNIWSNTGVKNGTGLDGGHLEFWSHNYGPANTADVPGASPQIYDFGDRPVEPNDGYGSMQIHNAAARQTLFAINHWRRGEQADIGLGNADGQHTDWTFAGNAHTYSHKRLRVLVRLAE